MKNSALVCICEIHAIVPVTLPKHTKPLNHPSSRHILYSSPFLNHRRSQMPLYTAEAINEQICNTRQTGGGKPARRGSRCSFRRHSMATAQLGLSLASYRK